MTVIHPSDDIEWGTPDWLLEDIRANFAIGLDPASSYAFNQRVKARLYYGLDNGIDGLTASWDVLQPGEIIFVNPPYGRKATAVWADTIGQKLLKGARMVALLPARVGTRWFQSLVRRAYTVCGRVIVFEGRLSFVRPDGSRASGCGKFDSALVMSDKVAGFKLRRDHVEVFPR